jgi:Tfp pilus assembly protein PilN
MIQFNLLPDIKLEYIKTRRTKRSIIVISLAIAGASLGIFVLLFMTVNVLQKQHINNLNKDIKKYTNDLKGIEDLDRILTVQNQLNKLTELHDSKPVISRFKSYISQITPAQVSYASITLDVTNGTIKFTGSADSLRTVNQFVDTLKFTKYSVGDETEQKNAFSEVVLTGFGKDDKGASYDINLKFDPTIFASQSDVKLAVPSIVTTRSAIERPDDNLLIPLSNPEGNGGQ